MIKLTIKKADGSSYWDEYFNDVAAAEKWLAVEKTRKYWNESYLHTLIDLDPFDPVEEQKKQDAIAKKQQREQKRLDRITALKNLDWSSAKTIADLKPILKVLVEDFLKDEA